MSKNSHPHPENQKVAKPDPGHEDDAEHDGEEAPDIAHRFLFFNVMPSWMVSFVIHVAIIIVLAIMFLPKIQDPRVSLEAGDTDSSGFEQLDVNFDPVDADSLEADETAEMPVEEVSDALEEPESLADLTIEDFGTEFSGDDSSFLDEALEEVNLQGNETSARSETARQAQVRKYGGNAESENAVEMALEWLARHQLPDGGWNLDHTQGPDVDKEIGRDKNNPGVYDSARNGATALALLPFLGHGDTHIEGKYKDVVEAGLNFLKKNADAQGRGLSWHDSDGTMYSHGLTAIVFAEAYAMTEDSELATYAQGAIWFIEDAQDRQGGGWRYVPKEMGDTSAVGWQLMALKSAKLSEFDYSPKTIKRAEKFLDRVSIDNGAWYGYMERPYRNSDGSYSASRKGVSSVGLLCRMYMGWGRDHNGLTKGVARISQLGPSIGTRTSKNSVDMYYNYYATQVMKHWGGSDWDEWNRVMRDFLVDQQETKGTKKGSWYWNGNSHSAEAGGRLYHTAMAAMTLEVYYRYLPLYKDEATEDEFPLD